MPFSKFAEMGGYGEEVRDPGEIGPALRRAREEGLTRQVGGDQHLGRPNEYAPGTKAQTMYK